ncbi:SIR2 family protein [Ruminococcus flavefaciens]|uniref:SIR2 family protein n=1 Tax=Ruminococcus flavefaciens TaxID=1265 RepID=UPI0026EC53D7|nr:SIR2 family protein [Ruminococcus flavefaciens]
MDKIIEQIEKIREINKQHKLVIFVGAGVSRNSGVCSWWDLVKDIAIKIDYNDICEKCELKYLTYTEGDVESVSCKFNNRPCQYEFNYSNEEFLKIPQYFYEEKGEKEYLEFLNSVFGKHYDTNAIDELIVALEPEHIITTNYDHLIEDVKNPSISNYTVIKSNNDLLEKGRHGRKYIIKMHGDIDDLDNIVLKEDDYLTYSLNHELLEIYIKSILIDKTILFVGYSLGDNNLKLIMSYINYFANTLKIERPPHYLAVNKIDHEVRETQYWLNKGVELVDLSKVSDFMKEKTRCDLKPAGKPLYSFLSYIKNDRLPYYKDGIMELKRSLLNSINSLEPFKRISCSTLLSICSFSRGAELQNGVLNILDSSDYDNLRSILIQNDGDSSIIKECFLKTGVKSIYHKPKLAEAVSYDLITDVEAEDELFNLSINWDYSKIVEQLSTIDNIFEKAYYYSLIYRTKDNICLDILSKIESDINQKDFKYLTLNDKYQIAILKFNLIAIRLLCFNSQRDPLDNLNKFIDSTSTESKAFEYIKKYINDNGKDINELNKLLLKHEEYYMRKSTMTKYGGTIYGDLFKLQAIVYDYYFFYKKNYLMLDWFNNVSKMCEPYIKAILCTYYPDEYQFSNPALGRTHVKPYPLNITDINLIIRHVKYKDFISWISYYKVFSLSLIDGLDITEIFENFCISIRSYWLTEYAEHINLFGKLLSMIEFSKDERHKILLAFLKLVTPDDNIGIVMLRTCLKALWLFVDKHYDADDSYYAQLLELLIDEDLLTDSPNDYINLINMLSPQADKKIYDKCCSIIDHCNSERKKAYYPYVFRDILLKHEPTKWRNWIIDNLEHNWTEEVFDYLEKKIIPYDEVVSKYFEEKLKNIKEAPGVKTIPDIKSELINSIVILHILGIIPDLDDMSYLNQYCKENSYLDFLLNPESFDYSKINTADYMWCNFIANDKFRERILEHKSEFWSKEDEKRIELGFGGSFENQIAYKYLFD